MTFIPSCYLRRGGTRRAPGGEPSRVSRPLIYLKEPDPAESAVQIRNARQRRTRSASLPPPVAIGHYSPSSANHIGWTRNAAPNSPPRSAPGRTGLCVGHGARRYCRTAAASQPVPRRGTTDAWSRSVCVLWFPGPRRAPPSLSKQHSTATTAPPPPNLLPNLPPNLAPDDGRAGRSRLRERIEKGGLYRAVFPGVCTDNVHRASRCIGPVFRSCGTGGRRPIHAECFSTSTRGDRGQKVRMVCMQMAVGRGQVSYTTAAHSRLRPATDDGRRR